MYHFKHFQTDLLFIFHYEYIILMEDSTMKLLRVRADHFKNCENGYTIDLVAKSKKTSFDKEYELHEIADGLFTFVTLAFAGKNASGKTSALNLLESAYQILESFRLRRGTYSYDGVSIEIVFYQRGYVYKYQALLKDSPRLDVVFFENQHLYKKKYYKTYLKSLYEFAPEDEMRNLTPLPKDTSSVFEIIKNQENLSICFDQEFDERSYRHAFLLLDMAEKGKNSLPCILRIFDENIRDLVYIDADHYKLSFLDEEKVLSSRELYSHLSKGTTKGIALYAAMAVSLEKGLDLLVDEVENHFHKSLVENMISLYKDKRVNKFGATLIFTTHYPELLDDIGRQDNVFICKAGEKLRISSLHDGYDIRAELLKSRQYYANAFDTAVNYDELMNLKRILMS